MADPVLHQGQWWVQDEYGRWSRWDAAAEQWVPYYPGAHRARTYDRLSHISKWVIGGVAFDMLFQVVNVFVAAANLASLGQRADVDVEAVIESGDPQAFNELVGVTLTSQLAGSVSAIVGLIFVFWFERAYQNLAALNTSGRYGTGWAIGSWFVPLMNLWRPKQIADDIWRASDPTLPTHPGHLWLAGRVPPLMNLWWAAWVISALVLFVALPLGFIGQDLATQPFVGIARGFNFGVIASGVARILAGAFVIPVVRQMTERQERRAAQLGVLPTT